MFHHLEVMAAEVSVLLILFAYPQNLVSWTGLSDNPRLVAKSCPTTPHGSVPDLFQQNGDDEVDIIVHKRAPR